jgi:hypothetical protein
MNHSSTLISTERARAQSRLRDWTRWYYTGAASVMLAVVLAGFQQFFRQGKAYPGQN